MSEKKPAGPEFAPAILKLVKSCDRNEGTVLGWGCRSATCLRDIIADFSQNYEEHEHPVIIAPGNIGIPLDTVMAGFEERLEYEERRLSHALKRIKEAGLYTDDFSKLFSTGERVGDRTIWYITRFVRASYDAPAAAHKIDDDIWFKAIDMAMFIAEPQLFSDGTLYGRAVKEHIGLIWLFVHLFYLAWKQGDAISRLIDYVNTHADEISETLDAREELKNVKADREEAEARAAAKLSQLQDMIDAAKANERAAQKSVRPLERENEKLAARVAELEAALEAVTKERDELLTRIEEETEEPDGDEVMTFEPLPENVVFVGGHPNFVKKLRQRHPEWTYVEAHDKTAEFKKVDLVLFWHKHLTHPVYDNVRNQVGPDVPLLYLESTNLDRLDMEARQLWTAYRAGESRK